MQHCCRSSQDDYEKKLKQVAKENRSFQLPDALTLNQALSALGMDYFLENTGLIDKLANRHLKESGIYIAIELAFYDYGQYVKNNMPPSLQEISLIHPEMKLVLIEAIIRVSKEVDR